MRGESGDNEVGGQRGLRRRWTAAALILCGLACSAFAREASRVYLIRLDGVINEAYSKAIQRKMTWAGEQGAEMIILELDTPGGEVGASMDLGDFLLKQDDLRVIAYINTDAYSGGTMVALACDEIYMDATLGVMGDVAPITFSGEELGEKLQSPIRKKLETYAAARGYPIALVQAMVTKEIEVYRLEMDDDPAPRYVTGVELDLMPEQERQKVLKKDIVCPGDQLLTLSAKEAVQYGFARQTVTSRQALYDALKIKDSEVQRLYLTGSERVLTVLDTFSPLLFAAGLILLFIEFSQPGFGLPGIAGLACIGAFFFVKFTLNYAHLLEILLFLAGIGLLMTELLVIPGFGVTGMAGIVLVFASVVLMFQQFTLPGTPGETRAFVRNLGVVMATFIVTGAGLALVVRYVGSIPILSRLVNRVTLAASTVGRPVRDAELDLGKLVGGVGITLTPLRPAGRAEFSGRPLDVVTEGDFLERGTQVVVVEVRGRQVVVKARQDES